MKMRLFLLLVIFNSCGLFSSKNAKQGPEIGDLIIGWNEMLLDIEENVNDKDSLSGKQYKLILKLSGTWELTIKPEKAVSVTPIENEAGHFIVKILNPSLLFDTVSGIVKRSYIEAKLTKIGGDMGKINLTGSMDCQFDISYHQVNGEKVNFEQISSGYIDEFIISHPEILKLVSRKKDSVTFSRPFGGEEQITLLLKLIDKNTNEVYESPMLSIPSCNRITPMDIGVKRIARTADQCLVHLKGGPQVFANKDPMFRVMETYANNCPDPIVCKLKAKYGLVLGPDLKKVFFKNFSFQVDPQDSHILDTSYLISPNTNWNFDSKVYLVPTHSKESLPFSYRSKLPADELQFIECNWLGAKQE